MRRNVLFFWVCMAGCGAEKETAAPREQAQEADTSRASKTEAVRKVPPVSLPATGMLCQANQVWAWSPNGETPMPMAGLSMSAAGELFDVLVGSGPESLRFLRDNRVRDLGTEASAAFVAGEGEQDVLVETNGTYMVKVGGRWEAVAGLKPGPTDSVARAHGSWWWASRTGLFKFSTPNDVKKVELPGSPFASVALGAELLVAHATRDRVMVSSINAAGAIENLYDGPLSALVILGFAVSNVDGWVAFGAKLSGTDNGLVLVRSPGKKFEPIGKQARLVALDGYNRLWYMHGTNVVAREGNGVETAYPTASKKMFSEAFAGLRCYPVGKGFDTLPAADGALTGGIHLSVKGAGAWPFEACKILSTTGESPCAGQPDRVTGTLDQAGQWVGQAPLGMYSFAFKRDRSWLQPSPTGNGKQFCQVTRERECRMQFVIE